jgi:membrane-bound lytic murein transglycosylase MltF
MNLLARQLKVKKTIEDFSKLFSLDPTWPLAIAMTESSLGINQKSPTGCKGVFQMSSIAMKDLLQEMEKTDDDLIDTSCGTAYLYLLLKRHKTIEEATAKYCNPADRSFYIDRVVDYMKIFKQE